MKGGKEVFKHWQVVAAYNAASTWNSKRSRVLHWRRHVVSTAASPTWAAGNLSEVADWVLGKEASVVSTILLCLWSCTSRNSWTSQWFPYYSGIFSLTTARNILVLAILHCLFSLIVICFISSLQYGHG